MRILIMTPWTSFWSVGRDGGVPDSFFTFHGLASRGHELHVVAPAGARFELEGPTSGTLTVHEVPYPGVSGRLGQLRRVFDLARDRRAFGTHGERLVRRLEPQVIVAHSFHTAPWASRIGQALDVPVVAKFFGVMLLNTGWTPRLLHLLRHFEYYLAFRRRYARVLILDDGTGGDEAARRMGVPAERLLFWPNGVNTEWGDLPIRAGVGDPDAKRRLGLDPEVFHTLTLARLEPLKRLDRVLRMLVELRARGERGVVALIAGDGPLRTRLEEDARRLGIGDQARFLGPVPHAQVPAWLEAADLYLAPHDPTNACVSICEAMLCGVPVVAMEAGTTRSTVVEGESGVVVARDDVAAMASAVERLATDPGLRERLGVRGREIARRQFVSWKDRVAMESDLLEELAGAGAS